jgi:hypothetical protein
MRARSRAGTLLLAAGAIAFAPRAAAQSPEERAAGRKILQQWQDSVVNVRVVVKMRVSMGGREMQASEETIESVATLLDSSGLAVMSLQVLNPGGFLKQMMGGMSQGGAPQFDMTSEPTDVRMRMKDGSELQAKVALRDEDLNLAFIRPTTAPPQPLTSLDTAAVGQPVPLDPVVIVSRLGRVGGWGGAASLVYVQAVIEKPRPMYVAQPGGIGGLGTPAFLLDGKLAGFVVMRSVTGTSSGMMGMMSGNAENMGLLPIILPAADVREVAKQAAKP